MGKERDINNLILHSEESRVSGQKILNTVLPCMKMINRFKTVK